MVLNSNTLGNNSDQVNALSGNRVFKAMIMAIDNSGNGMLKAASERQVHLGSRVSFKAVSAIMQKSNDGESIQTGVNVTQYNPDGSEVHCYYDNEGNLETMGFRSAEYVNGYNDKVGASSFNSMISLVNNIIAITSENTPNSSGGD